MPDGFEFPVRKDLWLPLRLDPAETARGEEPDLEVFGRLKYGVSLEQARAELTTISSRLDAESPRNQQGGADRPALHRGVQQRGGGAMLYVILGAVFGVLLIACSNVMNLLARAAGRWRCPALPRRHRRHRPRSLRARKSPEGRGPLGG